MVGTVLAHTIWMDEYAGDVKTIYRGKFKFDLVKHKSEESGELFNFAPSRGSCYGYIPFAPGGRWFSDLSLERIAPEATRTTSRVEGATIIWTAPSKELGCRVVVGWYRDATVFRKAQDHKLPNGKVIKIYFQTPSGSCFLLPPSLRQKEVYSASKARHEGIEGSWPGNIAIFYVGEKNPQLARQLQRYVETQERAGYAQSAKGRRVDYASGLIAQDLDQDTDLLDDIREIEKRTDVPQTTKKALIDSRIGQGKYRRNLESLWDGACSVTGCKVREVLRASHIKPWRCSTDKERLNAHNGLLLTATLDAAFETGLISFALHGDMLISDRLSKAQCEQLGIPRSLLKPVSQAQAGFLAFHRNHWKLPT